MSQSIIIIGASGHAAVVAQAARACGCDVIGHLADKASPYGIELLGKDGDLGAMLLKHKAAHVFVAIGDNHVRRTVVNRLRTAHPGIRFASIIHPSAILCEDGSVGEGAFIAAGAVVAAGARVGAFAIVNTRASLDHHASLGDFASMAPASATGGGAVVGSGTAVGMGAMVHHGVRLGEDVVLGSLSLANKDIPDRVVAVGNPARVLRPRTPGETYL